ncbi:RNA polymerase sigma factor sigW [Actinoplanes sp. SE50]|uniref:SigE family RNA polymerase sigma factor n=1 Tax=unclassified Actinoplanes TaxID=2626549 RepID=UPI00023ED620|nr:MULTISPECIES: SigE family RNA polymerase sigma factor [unclassified Actinoplanes]AEV85036.1 RNA polymerase sigma factor sigW [Actinoplanes sp. SE50/110]ATO83427.1 RNA polymerase sigma factor sigW [Actinoplanes sp. SE50]SLM00834.1 RNA polymerase sigma factor SigW [Actinoplanes sp. SE50/110]
MRVRQRRHTDETFSAFVAARSGRLIAHAELLCGHHEQARDIVQSALVRAYRRWQHIEQDDPYGYLHRAVTNAVIDWWRTAHQRHEQPVDVLPDLPPVMENTVEDRHSLLAALDALAPRERAVVVLRYLDDYTERETAEALGVTLGTVKSTCFRALRKLRVSFADPASGESLTEHTDHRP